MEKTFFTKKELMQYLSVSRATIDKFMQEGLPYIKLHPGRRGGVRFKRSTVDHWLEKKKIG